WLVDIHGPHEHQSLLNTGSQLFILDAFGKLEGTRRHFAELVTSLAALEAEKKGLIVDDASYAQKLDLLRFQAGEIGAAGLEVAEDETVEQEYRRASNAAKLLQLSQAALNVLSENDGSLLDQAAVIGRTLQELLRVDSSATMILDTNDQAVSALRQLQSELSNYAEKVD